MDDNTIGKMICNPLAASPGLDYPASLVDGMESQRPFETQKGIGHPTSLVFPTPTDTGFRHEDFRTERDFPRH